MINELNASGPRVLPLVPAAGDVLPPFRDTNWDNRLEALDVLNIINFLNGATGGGEGEWDGQWDGEVEPESDSALLDAAAVTAWTDAPAPQPLSPVPSARPLAGSASASRGRPDTTVHTVAPARVIRGLDATFASRPLKEPLWRSDDALDFDRTLDEIVPDVAQTWGAA